MKSSRISIVMAALLAFSISFVFADEDAPKTGKVRLVIGDVDFQKKGAGSWKKLKVNGRVQEKDKIKTQMESTVSIAMPDGSVLAVGENSEVEFSELLMIDGSQVSSIDIKTGKIRFDVQKQRGSNSSFKFKTGTATASIRGTDGIVGVTKGGQAIGSLNSGAMDMEQDGKVVNVKPQQFVAMRKGKAPIVGEAKNAGDPAFMDKISEMVDDTTKSDAEILEAAKALDAEIEKGKEDLRSKYNCKFESLPAMVDTNAVTVTATCTAGLEVSLGGETIKSTGEPIKFEPSWEVAAYGDKKFLVTCSAEGKSFECARLATVYKKDRLVKLGRVDDKTCAMEFTTSGFEGNKGSLRVFADDSLLQLFNLAADTTASVKLVSGAHEYKFVPENSDANVGLIKQNISCFPATEVGIDFKGGTKETIRKKVSQGSAAYPEVVFSLKNVPNNDPAQIKSVEVKVDGKTYITQYAPSKEGIGYRATIRIARGKTTMATVVVTMQNGQVSSAVKSYEFK
ncbi:MAG: FecR domain-containing protein [Fibrobacter sp.]|nr:FecR domain-containing protein [Fibrobacter sp.]